MHRSAEKARKEKLIYEKMQNYGNGNCWKGKLIRLVKIGK